MNNGRPTHRHEWTVIEPEFCDGNIQITVFMCKRCGTSTRVMVQEGMSTSRYDDVNCDEAVIGSIMRG